MKAAAIITIALLLAVMVVYAEETEETTPEKKALTDNSKNPEDTETVIDILKRLGKKLISKIDEPDFITAWASKAREEDGLIDQGVDKVKESLDTAKDAFVEGAASAISTAKPTESEDIAGQVKAEYEAQNTIRVTGEQARGEPKGEMGVLSADVNTKEDLEAYMVAVAQNDNNIEEITVYEEEITLRYRHEARLLGLIPVTMTTRTTVDEQGRVRVRTPWWSFLARHGAKGAEEEIEEEIEKTDEETYPGVYGSVQERMRVTTEVLSRH